MRCPNCGGTEFKEPEAGADGGIVACAACDLAVDPSDETESTHGVAPMPSPEENVPVMRPDTGEDGRGLVTELPPVGATREEWDAAAVKLGIDPATYSNKDTLIEALTAHVERVPDTSLNAPEPDAVAGASGREEDQG